MSHITEPLRLAVGSHSAGSGKGCAMNVVSWENGDATISGMPDCADPFLARVVQDVNDRYCTHRDGSDLLCPPCSVEVLALAHRTVGTRLDMSDTDRVRVYVEIAVEQAERVLHLTTDERPRAAVALVRRWLAGEAVTRADLAAANASAYAASAAASAHAAAAASAHAAAAASAHAAHAASAHAHAASANAHAAAGADRLAAAHHIIDRFNTLTGTHAPEPDPHTTRRAIAAMHATT